MTTLESLFARYGLLAIFLGAGIEGETAVVIGGVVAHRGLVSPIYAILAAALGSFVADQYLFWLGRRHRERPRIAKLLGRAPVKRARDWIERYPTGFIVAFRFIYGIRIASPIALGASSVSARTFFLLNLLSAFAWAACFIGIGFTFSATMEATLGKLHRVELVIAILLVVAGLTALALRRRFQHWDSSG